jgi:hypothetical protein
MTGGGFAVRAAAVAGRGVVTVNRARQVATTGERLLGSAAIQTISRMSDVQEAAQTVASMASGEANGGQEDSNESKVTEEQPKTGVDEGLVDPSSSWDDALFKAPEGYPGLGMEGTHVDHAFPQAAAKGLPALEPRISDPKNLRELRASVNSVDKAPLDKELADRFKGLVKSLMDKEGLHEEQAIEKAWGAMKEEIKAHTNSVPARPMDPAEIERLKELSLDFYSK